MVAAEGTTVGDTPEGAAEEWTFQRGSDQGSSPVVVGEHVYVQGEKRIACVELATGQETWNTTLDLASPQYTSLVAADGKVIYAYDGLLCFAADAKEFRPLFDTKFDKQGVMATDAALRKQLKHAEIEKKPNGLEESTRIYQREVPSQPPGSPVSEPLSPNTDAMKSFFKLFVACDMSSRAVSFRLRLAGPAGIV